MNEPFSPWSNEDVLHALYTQLRAIAHARLKGDRAGTLSPTALVNEALLRLLPRDSDTVVAGFQDESHFIAACATAMRHVMVDRARRKLAGKRQEPDDPAALDDEWTSFQLRASPEALLDVNRELERLQQEKPELAQLVELRVFGGLTYSELGALLDMETKTAERRWRYAAAILRQRMEL